MMTKTKLAFAAALVFGSASVALADGYEDHAADAIYNYGPVVQRQAPAQSVRERNAAARQTRPADRSEQPWSTGQSDDAGD